MEVTMVKKIAIVILSTSFTLKCNAASFDCNKAASLPEMTICNDPVLSKLDDELSEIYKRAKSKATDQREFQQQTQAAWKWRETNCQTRECLVNWYAQRKLTLLRVAGTPPVTSCPANGPVTLSGTVVPETLTLEPDGRKSTVYILVASPPFCVRVTPLEPTDKSGARNELRTKFQLVNYTNPDGHKSIAKFVSQKVTVTGNLSTDNITQYYAVTDAIDVKSIRAM